MIKIPLDLALPLVRDFGLLVNQAAIYGVTHRVIQQQAVDFFNRIHKIAEEHKTVEFSIQGDKLGVNGEIEGMDLMSTRNLKDRMTLHKLPGIFFSPDLTQDEFLTFLSCLAKPPVRVQEMGGFDQVLKNANMKGVSLVHFVYERVDTSTSKNEPPPPPKEEQKKAPVKQPKREPKKTFELLPEESQEEIIEPEELEKQVTVQASRKRKKVQAELDSLLTEVSDLVAHEDESEDAAMVKTLRSIRDTLRTSTETSKERIVTFLQPAQTIEVVTETGEVQKKKTKAHKLTHAEYMRRFAELVQEIAQPLTVTNSVIEILGKGQAGPLTESQANFLGLALDSVDRVNQLIKYMHTLYGEPDSYIPEAAIIQETYK
jgi:hypothetical protein